VSVPSSPRLEPEEAFCQGMIGGGVKNSFFSADFDNILFLLHL
jgi:hypothetical protein